MKLLLVHNRYRHPGGEDAVFRREGELLRLAGHQVFEYIRQNTDIADDGVLRTVGAAMRTLWGWDSVQDLRSLLRKVKPELVHFHNTFPLISPAAYYVCKEQGMPVV